MSGTASTRIGTTPLYLGVRVGKGNQFAPVLPGPPEWTERAACTRIDPDTFFPEVGPEVMRDVRAAKATCQGCPVRRECLAAALARREPHGVWGGLTTNERRALTPRTGRPKHFRPTREFDATVAALTAAGCSLAEIAIRLDTTDRRVSRARARLAEQAATDTPTTEPQQRRAA